MVIVGKALHHNRLSPHSEMLVEGATPIGEVEEAIDIIMEAEETVNSNVSTINLIIIIIRKENEKLIMTSVRSL
jgi:hypothetical protein